MGSPAELLRRMKRLTGDQLVDNALQENTDQYRDLQQIQLLEGQNAQGGTIKPGYASPYYARMKARLNPLPGLNNPDLQLTGARNENMTVTLEQDRLVLDSDVEYNKFLEEHYGPRQIWGLADRNLKTFRSLVWDTMQRIVTDETGLV